MAEEVKIKSEVIKPVNKKTEADIRVLEKPLGAYASALDVSPDVKQRADEAGRDLRWVDKKILAEQRDRNAWVRDDIVEKHHEHHDLVLCSRSKEVSEKKKLENQMRIREISGVEDAYAAKHKELTGKMPEASAYKNDVRVERFRPEKKSNTFGPFDNNPA